MRHIWLSLWLAPALASAQSSAGDDATPPSPSSSEPGAEPRESPATLTARRHFENGIRLFQDNNFSAALVEFEAAFHHKPGAASLQNIALCQKALFRYGDAVRTLEDLLRRFASGLNEEDKANIRAATQELRALTRRVVIQVKPASAKLSVDGTALTDDERAQGLVLNVGEHQLVASAPGYATHIGSVRIASGSDPKVHAIELKPTAGFVTVITEQKGAAIAIDGKALDYDRWSGPLAPGEHVLQIYKAGHETVEEVFEVRVGERKLVRASAGGALEESTDTSTQPAVPQRGWYGLGAFNLMLVPDAPDGVRVENSFSSGAMSWGGRAGYRLLDPLGVEVLLEGGLTRVTDACIEPEDAGQWEGVEASCEDSVGEREGLDYAINAFRLGGNLRVFSSGSRARFTSALGFGGVQHNFELLQPKNGRYDAHALNAYVLVEVGVQFNLNHLLLEADFVTYVESRGSLGNDDRELFNEGGLKSLGVGLKAGWSEWNWP